MQITQEWLKRKNACSSAIALFNSRFPNGGDIKSVLVMITQDDGAADDEWVAWLMLRAKYNGLEWLNGLEINSLYLRGTGITSLPSGCKINKKNIPKHLKDKVIL